MTHFERDYLASRRSTILQSQDNGTTFAEAFARSKEQFALQMNYRELDRLSAEMERELREIQMLRAELEKYKVEFNLQIENEATKKIQEVLNSIEKMFA